MRLHTLIGVGTLVLAAAVLAQEGFVLRRVWKEGEADVYKLEFSSKQVLQSEAMGGEQEFGVSGSMKYATKVGKFDSEKKLTDVEVTLSDAKFNLQGMAAMMQPMIDQLPKEIKSVLKHDDRHRAVPAKRDPKSAQWLAAMDMFVGGGSDVLAYPEQAVKIGDSWEVVVPKLPVYGNREFKLKAKLTGEKQVGNVLAVVLVYDGTLPLDMDLTPVMAGNAQEADATQGARLVGPVTFHMEATIDKATGKLLALVSTGKGKQKLEMPNVGASIDVSGDSTTKLTLVPPAPPSGSQ